MRLLGALCLCYFLLERPVIAGRVLVVTPLPFHSHQIPYQNLWKALVSRGHQVVLVNAQPMENFTQPNLRQISLQTEDVILTTVEFAERSSWTALCQESLMEGMNQIADSILGHAEVKALYQDPAQEFDLVITEFLYTPAMFALGHRFGAPIIGIVSVGMSTFGDYSIGDVLLPSYPSTWETAENAGLNLSFWTRMKNFLRIWFHIRFMVNEFAAQQQSIAEKHLGQGIPWVLDLQKNVSLVFVDDEPAISFARPRAAKIVQYTGFHFPNDPAPLPKDIEQFLGNGTEGFIYFSLGTIVRSGHLTSQTRAIFLEVFSNLPCKVLWKYEGELPGLSSNVYTAKRFPQYSVLADPRIKLFIYHGGLHSTQEAIHYTVPVIGMPVFVDQHQQVNKLVSLGVARRLNVFHLTKQALQEEILEMLRNDSYKRRMKELKALVNDKPHKSLEKLVWWTEYVMRWRGAAHLNSAIAEEPWYRRYDVDVLGFLAVASFLSTVCGLALLYKVLVIASRFRAATLLSTQKKKTL